MPTYLCHTGKGKLSPLAQKNIAADISLIHSLMTKTSPELVQTHFIDNPLPAAVEGKNLLLISNSFAYAEAKQARIVAESILDSILAHTDIPPQQINIDLTGTNNPNEQWLQLVHQIGIDP